VLWVSTAVGFHDMRSRAGRGTSCAQCETALDNRPMKSNWTNYLVTALIAIGAVYLYNTFVAPKAGLPTA